MRFSIIVSKWANFYFFIQNLSEWHFSNEKDYNELWRNELSEFSIDEETAIKKFKEIRLKHKTTKTLFEHAFYASPEPWRKLKEDLQTEEYKSVQGIFEKLESKFNLLWEKDSLLLTQWQNKLDNNINEPLLTKSIMDTLCILLNTTPSEPEIKIYLLFSSPNHTGGGANIDKQSIGLEISRYPIQDINHAIGIIWHEIIHLCFQNQYFYPLLIKYFSEDRQNMDIVNEATIGSLFPKGILGIRLLKNKPAYKLMTNISPEQTIEIINLAKKYVNDKISLDEKFISTLSEILKKESPTAS